MSKFKVGDRVRRKLDYVTYGEWSYGRDTLTVSKIIGHDLSVGSDPEYWDMAKFELVEDAKPAPLIDGPGLYRRREGGEVTIVKLRTDLISYPEHVWEDNTGDCYRPSGSWNAKSEVESAYDIVEKISSTPTVAEQLRDYDQSPANPEALVRQFASGATRNLDNNKYDYEGFLSPLVIEAFGKYMHSHRLQKDGKMRDSDNWQLGIGFDVYMKSGWRHFFDWWKLHRGLDAASPEDGHKLDKVEALCALMFNVQGYMHELLKEQVES